ncbi:phosphotransferase enzyme family protein [Bacillus paramycoides]|uniref:phosphotransferase enzyme family protein n=1 Tax=Bacillus paramycoides TaxID=2026194 RepID=UPI002E1A8689|nr:phosphotransferase [Bacillus paramycoides]
MEQVLEISKFWIKESGLSSTPINPKVTLITMGKQNYVLKKKGDLDQIIAEIKLLTILSKHNIKVQQPLKTLEGEYFILYEDTYYCMYEYLIGNAPEVKDIARLKVLTSDIGKEIAKLHQALSKLNTEVQFIERNLYMDIYKWAIPTIEESQIANSKVIQLMKQLKPEMEEILPSLPKQIIHRDTHLSNLVFEKNSFTGFLDFEIAEVNVKIFDICYCLTSILSELFTDEKLKNQWFSLIKPMIEGYNNQNPLTQEERSALWHVMLGIQVIFMTYFISSPEILKINQDMFLWIYENKKMIEECVGAVSMS